jgi:hypothetical protein
VKVDLDTGVLSRAGHELAGAAVALDADAAD